MGREEVRLSWRYLQLNPLSRHRELIHAFSTRRGGKSHPPFSSLNLSFQVGDDPTRVQENRDRLLKDLTLLGRPLVSVRQIHGDGILVVDEELARQERFPLSLSCFAADAIVTDVRGIILTVSVADCVPVIIYDPGRMVIAAVHGGWRSTVAGLTSKVVSCLVDEWGTRPADCQAALGPSLGPCCYEVGEEVAEAFIRRFGEQEGILSPLRQKGKWWLDLARAQRALLLESGLSPSSIFSSGYCTSCRSDLFYSYRRDKAKTGRMMGLVMLREEYGEDQG